MSRRETLGRVKESLGEECPSIECGACREPRLAWGHDTGGGPIGVVKLLRARGECLGVIRRSGVEGCDKSGGAAQRASSPEYPSNPGN